MSEYRFPKVVGGYRWNMLQRCKWEVGIEPVASGDIGEETVLTFDRDLDQYEEQDLSILMQDLPTYPKRGDAVVFQITDLAERFEEFKETVGLPGLRMYFAENEPGSGVINVMEIHHTAALSEEQIETVIEAYKNLISLK